MSHQLLTALGDAVGRTMELAQGLRQALEHSLTLPEERRVTPENEFVGGFGRRAVVSDATTGLRSVSAEVRAKGGPSSTIDAIEDALDDLRTVVRQRNAGEWDLRTVQALRAEFERRYEVLANCIERYDAVMDDWLATLPERTKHIGIRVGTRWYINARDVANLAGTTEDAARKYMAAHVKEFYPFGRLKYWDLEDVRDAVRRRDVAEEATKPTQPPASLPGAGRRKPGRTPRDSKPKR